MPVNTSRRFRTAQAAHSTTFTAPPLDGSLTVPELFAFQARHSGSHTLFAYAEEGCIRTIDYEAAFRAQKVAASIAKVAFDAGAHLYNGAITQRPVIGILAIADSITYATLLFGIQQTGAVPFPISARNSAQAVAHLLRATNVHQIFVSEDAAMQALVSEALALLATDGYAATLIVLPRFESLYAASGSSFVDDYQITPFSVDAPVLILHSSGTSSFPKPIQVTNRNYIGWGSAIYYGDVDMCGTRLGIHAIPLFHAIGAIALIDAVCTGVELGVFRPVSPPVVPNAGSLLENLVDSNSDWVMTVPSFVEEWARTSDDIQTLKAHVKRILYGGGPLDRRLGDIVRGQGVLLDNLFGMTETGALCMTMASEDLRPPEWEFFRLASPELVTINLDPQGDGDGLLEPVMMEGKYYSPNVFNTAIDGRRGFATGDLIQEHPSFKGFYKIYGRVDDQIVLSTGEKTNPIPLERILHQDPNISLAIIFGRGRFNNGVLVQPITPFSPDDAARVAEYRDLIWPTVSAMNAHAPAHSRLLKEMILVANPDKPLEVTAKGTARRKVCLAQYEDEIASIYRTSKDTSHVESPPPATWNHESSLKFVQDLVQTVLGSSVAKHDDLFVLGCDSLGATLIHNNIVRVLRASTSTSTLAGRVPQTVVYQNPSIQALSNFIVSLIVDHDIGLPSEDSVQRKAREMVNMVTKYSAGLLPLRTPSSPDLASVMEIILLTGSTGRLGCHLLAQLIHEPTVRHIYALNRVQTSKASPQPLLVRMSAAFAAWGLDPAQLSSGKVTLLACDSAAGNLGLDAVVYNEIKSQVTTIIHNAWRVDFNIALSSYEPLIAGVRNLIDLAVRAPIPGGARLLFVSSVAIFLGAPKNSVVPEAPVLDAKTAVGMGYGESKWVAESLLLRARDVVGLRATVVRLGQLAGDTHIGGWNKQEWVGAIARLGQIVNAIPDCDGPISWVPVDIAATALIDMVHSEAPVCNLVAPNPSNWHTVFGAFAKHLGVPLTAYDEWAARVAVAAETGTSEDAQPLALASFFRADKVKETVTASTARACDASLALVNMRPIGEKDVLMYLGFWKKIGHLRA